MYTHIVLFGLTQSGWHDLIKIPFYEPLEAGEAESILAELMEMLRKQQGIGTYGSEPVAINFNPSDFLAVRGVLT